MKPTVLALAAASLAVSAPRPANACSQPACWAGAFVPGDQARVPANVPGFYWRPMTGFGTTSDPKKVVLVDAAAPTKPIPLTARALDGGDFLLVPDVPLVANSRYSLTDHNVCDLGDQRGPQVVFAVGPAVPLPSDLGALVATPPSIDKLDLETRLGTCSMEATVAKASVELAPSAAAAAWLDMLHFETFVDGKPWHYQASLRERVPPGASPTGRARDLVFQVCASSDADARGLAAGTHVVTMHATLPGTTRVMASGSVDVTLSCTAPTEEPDDPPAENPDEPIPQQPSDGGCSAAGSGAPWLVLALVPLLRGTRRRRSR